MSPLLGAQPTWKKLRKSKAPLTFNSAPFNGQVTQAGHPGIGPGAWISTAPGSACAKRQPCVVESRLSHPFRGLGVSYGRGRGRGVDWPGAAYCLGECTGRWGGESRASAEAARGGEARVSARPFITRPARTRAAWVQPVPISRSLGSLPQLSLRAASRSPATSTPALGHGQPRASAPPSGPRAHLSRLSPRAGGPGCR